MDRDPNGHTYHVDDYTTSCCRSGRGQDCVEPFGWDGVEDRFGMGEQG